MYNKKEIAGMLYTIKECMSEIFNAKEYEDEDEKVNIDELSKTYDKGLRLIEMVDEIIAQDFDKEDIITMNVSEDSEWHAVGEELPPVHKDILFSTISEQVFEGFFEKKNYHDPYITENGKIGFREYPDGGKWYRNRFRDLLDMKSVLAWRYKPAAYPNEKRRK